MWQLFILCSQSAFPFDCHMCVSVSLRTFDALQQLLPQPCLCWVISYISSSGGSVLSGGVYLSLQGSDPTGEYVMCVPSLLWPCELLLKGHIPFGPSATGLCCWGNPCVQGVVLSKICDWGNISFRVSEGECVSGDLNTPKRDAYSVIYKWFCCDMKALYGDWGWVIWKETILGGGQRKFSVTKWILRQLSPLLTAITHLVLC